MLYYTHLQPLQAIKNKKVGAILSDTALQQTEVAWRPNAGPQTAFIACPIFEIFFGGARGGGKTAGSLGDWASHSSLYDENARGLMVRRTRTELADTILESKLMYRPLGAKFHEQDKIWTMPNGAVFRFAFLENDADADLYQGHNYTRVYVEELGNFPSPDPVMKLMATLRSAKGVPVGFRGTGNPGGAGHQWVKARYIDPAPRGYKIIPSVFINPFTKQEVTKERIFIPSRLEDNPYLGDDYVAGLSMAGSKELVRAWLEGDWSVITGAYFPEFSTTQHVIPLMDIPAHWTRIRGMDWGSAAPFCVLWAAVSDGEPLTDSTGHMHWLPRDSLILYREWYGWNGTPNKGCKMMAQEVGQGIKEREDGELMDDEVLDPSAFASDGGPSIAERLDCNFRRADNKRVARVGVSGGWDAVRERLRGTDISEHKPLLYFMDNCVHSIRTLPALQHDPLRPEDVDTTGEDHPPDTVRYICMSRPLTRKKVQPESRRWATELTFNEIVKRATNKRLELE